MTCNDACAAGLELCVTEYRFVRRYLERSPQAPLTLRQVDPLIRDRFDRLRRKTRKLTSQLSDQASTM